MNNFGIGLTDKYWVKEGNNNKMSDISAVYILQFLMNNFDKIVSHHNDLYNYVKEKMVKYDDKITTWKLFPSLQRPYTNKTIRK